MSVVSVIGCGPSAIRCGAATSPGVRIAVNDAYRHVKSHYVVSMDGRWFKNRVQDFTNPGTPLLYIRRSTIKDDGDAWKRKYMTFDCDRETHLFGDHREQLNGENSGHCALNLAWLMNPEVIYLYGFDMNFENGSDHFFGNYEWKGQGCSNSDKKFKKWVADIHRSAYQFEQRGIKVYNTNPKSAVKCFEYGTPS